MKKILITGSNSYVGTSFTNYLNEYYPIDYEINEISVQGEEWKFHDFSNYDVILHVAGIAHVSTDPKMEDLYYKVNRDLTLEVAKKAKNENVKQFIFMSSMIVFGRPKDGVVTKDTKPNPENFYGKSKLEAEERLIKLATKDFNVVILRPPMIYGPGSKGNYPKLAKLARITPIFPNYPNKRSMLFIDNLSIIIEKIIRNNKKGTYHPQNNEYMQTSELVKGIARANNKKIYMIKIFNPLIKMMTRTNIINKVFGDLYYEKYIEEEKDFFSLKESILLTETRNEITKI